MVTAPLLSMLVMPAAWYLGRRRSLVSVLAVKSENLESQIVDVPRTTLPCVTVTHPVITVPSPTLTDLPIGPPGSVTVLGVGVGGGLGTGGAGVPAIDGLTPPANPTPPVLYATTPIDPTNVPLSSAAVPAPTLPGIDSAM